MSLAAVKFTRPSREEPDVNQIWIFSTDFYENPQYLISWKSVQWEHSLIHADRRTERTTNQHDEFHGRFSRLCELPLIRTAKLTFSTVDEIKRSYENYKFLSSIYVRQKKLEENLTLNVLCLILQYLYEPTRCTKFL